MYPPGWRYITTYSGKHQPVVNALGVITFTNVSAAHPGTGVISITIYDATYSIGHPHNATSSYLELAGVKAQKWAWQYDAGAAIGGHNNNILVTLPHGAYTCAISYTNNVIDPEKARGQVLFRASRGPRGQGPRGQVLCFVQEARLG